MSKTTEPVNPTKVMIDFARNVLVQRALRYMHIPNKVADLNTHTLIIYKDGTHTIRQNIELNQLKPKRKNRN